MIDYVIADDHPLFRQGVRHALADTQDIRCVGEAANGTELLELLNRTSPQVVLLDLQMPGMNGIDAASIIKGRFPGIKILALTMHAETQFLLPLAAIGIHGYLLKHEEPEAIAAAMRIVAADGYYFDDTVSVKIIKHMLRQRTQPDDQTAATMLTEEEQKMLELVCKEYSIQEIATKSDWDIAGAERIYEGLLQKTGARNIAGLVLYAFRAGLIA